MAGPNEAIIKMGFRSGEGNSAVQYNVAQAMQPLSKLLLNFLTGDVVLSPTASRDRYLRRGPVTGKFLSDICSNM